MVWVLLLLILLSAGWGTILCAADVKIEFVPPPMEGTISLGIYDSAGKLVRILHREAETSEFGVALNGLITKWDGNDNKGVACPPGKYRARGFMVGDLEVEGEDFIGNDWVEEDDSLRISRIIALAMTPSGLPVIQAQPPGSAKSSVFSVTLKPVESGEELDIQLVAESESRFSSPSLTVKDGKVQGAPLTGVTHASDAACGVNGAVWVIDGTAVKEFSATGELRRTLPAAPDDPHPVKLAASSTSERIWLLEENSVLQRLRMLEFDGDGGGLGAKERFEKIIRFSDRFEQVASLLKFPDEKPFAPAPVIGLTLVPNPLFQDKPQGVDVSVSVDAAGTFLSTTDGLPLYRISETPNLKWAVMGRAPGSKNITVFESDGSVVAQFKVGRLADMMAFEAGEVELAPTMDGNPTPVGNQDGETTAPSPAPVVSGTPSAIPGKQDAQVPPK